MSNSLSTVVASLALLSGCGARTGLDAIDLDARDGADAGDAAASCGCPDGMVWTYAAAAGCDAAPSCVEFDALCSSPSEQVCTCATHQPIMVACGNHDGTGVPVTEDPSCWSETGFLECDPVLGPHFTRDRPTSRCADDEICGHRDGARAFVCCDPSRECDRCRE